MNKEEIISYVMETPGNTNPNVLRSLLDSDGGGLPPVTSEDNGKVLTVQDGAWATGGVLVETAYSDLKALRDAGNLVPGTAYRITDYVTIINGKYDLSAIGASGYLHYAVSAGHPFDIIVMAVGESELSEVARAAHHDGDTYFANAAVDAWEVKYCLDNDASRFMWADATNGKGVIFGLKDEFNNECGYDFKNLMFPRYALKLADATADYTPVDTGLAYDASTQPNRYGSLTQIFNALQSYMQSGTYVNPWVQNMGGNNVNNYDFACGANILGVIQFAEIDAAYKAAFNCDLYYTFDCWNGEAHMDYSLNGVKVLCLENKIAETQDPLMTILGVAAIPNGVNGTVFENVLSESIAYCQGNVIKVVAVENTFGSSCSWNEIGANSYGNTFGNSCYSNTFGNYCYSNTFGRSCDSNKLGNNCYSNTSGINCSSNAFGNRCCFNTFGNNCDFNTFGNECNSNMFWNECNCNTSGSNCSFNAFGNQCDYNTFGSGCNTNTFGDSFSSNIFGTSCFYNTFGDSCNSNTLGDNCHSNTFGSGCNSNIFGNDCNSSTLGNDCFYNTFGNNCYSNTLMDFCHTNTLGNSVCFVEISGSSSNTPVGYYHICDMVCGQSSDSKLSIVGIPNRSFETWVGYNSSGTLKTWCPADLVQ